MSLLGRCYGAVVLALLGLPVQQTGAIVALPSREAEASGLSEEWDHGPVVLYDHMPKAGGTFLSRIIKAAVGPPKFGILREFQNLTRENKSSSYVIGSVRNPCDYYLSLWSYGAEHGGAMMSRIPQELRWIYVTRNQYKNSKRDVAHFRKWVRVINKPDHPGVMSLRFAKSYASLLHDDIVASAPPAFLDNSMLNAVKRAVNHEPMYDRVDCFVRTERLDEDTRYCLSQWSHNTGSTVHWNNYQKAFNAGNHFESHHGHCADYFDNETAELVFNLERPLFEHFNYSRCCAM